MNTKAFTRVLSSRSPSQAALRAGLELAQEQRAGTAVAATTVPHPGIELGDMVAFEDAIAPVSAQVVGLRLAVEGEGV